MTVNNDSEDLEALFDSVSSKFNTSEVKKEEPEDYESLFDKVSAQNHKNTTQDIINETTEKNENAGQINSEQTKEVLTDEEKKKRVFNKVGQMVRSINNTLGALGVDKIIEQAVSALPDAKDRLAYVANLTEQAACKVLNATDMATPLVEELIAERKKLLEQWDLAFEGNLSVDEFKSLAEQTRGFLSNDMNKKLTITKEQLTEIMMAQDFQDLTGQVLKKIVNLAQELESGLMEVLLDVVPEDKINSEVSKVNDLINGPVINPEGRTDVVVNQKQVDDLLESLGF